MDTTLCGEEVLARTASHETIANGHCNSVANNFCKHLDRYIYPRDDTFSATCL